VKPELVCHALFAGSCDPLDPTKCSERLASYWHDFQAARKDMPCLRVSTMNLVVVCQTPAEAEGAADDLEQIAGSFPARVVVAVLDSEATQLSGWFHARSLPERDQHLCWEMVGLHVPNGEQLPSLVIPLLRDGLPVFLWWRGTPPFASAWFEHLVETSRRVLLDSKTFDDYTSLGSYLRPVVALTFDKYHQEQAFSDLSWGRLRQWRELVTGLFDRPNNLLKLPEIKTLSIEYYEDSDDPAGPPPMPMYMAAWICSRMSWTPKQPLAKCEGGFATDCGQVQLRITAVPTDDPGFADRLLSVNFEGDGFEFGVERDEADPERIGLSGVFSREQIMRSLQRSRRATHALMAYELENLGRDAVFTSVLTTALELAGQEIPVREVAS